MTRDEFRKTATRMFKNVADPNFILDTKSCKGVHCVDCPIFIATNTTSDECMVNNCSIFEAFDVIEAVEQWTKEHPFVTYEQKYEETFGVKPVTEHGDYYCPCMTGYKCPHIDTNTLKSSVGCEDCKEQFWKSEYKLPKKESEVDGKTD